MLEKKDIILDINCVNNLVEKSYPRPCGSPNSIRVAEIMDILSLYGLNIDKKIIIKLLKHGCYVNNLEKYGISVDNEILAICAELSYYPYKFDIIPDENILKKECSKQDNLITIKKLKEFGGIYTEECLENACVMQKNSKVIKYLINDCGVKVSECCLKIFQDTYKIETLDLIVEKYISHNHDKTKAEKSEENKYIELNTNSTLSITPRNIKINIKDDTIEYVLKNKIKKFFKCDKKFIKYTELHELILKYLIANKLVIGKYFVTNNELSNLLKINSCAIININELNNILTYFIDLPE